MTVEGGCHCGAVRYVLAVDAAPAIYCCHCLNCQSWAGSAFTQSALLPDGAISVTGPVIEYRFINPSGHESHQRLCGTCHTRIFNTNSARPGLVVLRAGTLDESDRLSPRLHMWVRRKQPWVVIAEDIPTFEETPPIAEFVATMLR
ncbi:GFA family protein [Sphingomonas alpina]|uniref:GFA family protein n=1 Tax=Sphingomonas alpina TaxID=653931 RepID=A0A7H0LMW9_9SPHN|nr:GFA family protein [Sphingomonas alpina]QNQ11022.1 GFA family protein [Sphingomonas alpina]